MTPAGAAACACACVCARVCTRGAASSPRILSREPSLGTFEREIIMTTTIMMMMMMSFCQIRQDRGSGSSRGGPPGPALPPPVSQGHHSSLWPRQAAPTSRRAPPHPYSRLPARHPAPPRCSATPPLPQASNTRRVSGPWTGDPSGQPPTVRVGLRYLHRLCPAPPAPRGGHFIGRDRRPSPPTTPESRSRPEAEVPTHPPRVVSVICFSVFFFFLQRSVRVSPGAGWGDVLSPPVPPICARGWGGQPHGGSRLL